jgi:hypothetical protein
VNVDGRFVARVVMYLAGAAFLVLAGFSYDSDRITVRAVIAGGAVLAVGAVAALWLRRHPPRGGQS